MVHDFFLLSFQFCCFNLLNCMQQTGKFKEFKFQLEEVDSTDVVGGGLVKIRNSTIFFYGKERNSRYQISFRSSVSCTRHFQLTFLGKNGNKKNCHCQRPSHVRPDGALTRPVSISRFFALSLCLNGIAEIFIDLLSRLLPLHMICVIFLLL